MWGEDQPFMLAGKPGIVDGMVGIRRQSDAGIWSPSPPDSDSFWLCSKSRFHICKVGGHYQYLF